MLVKGYADFSLRLVGTPPTTCVGVEAMLCAQFRLDGDVSPLFPYLNGVAQAATFFEKPPFIRFLLDGILCGLHPDHGVAAAFADRDEALEFLERLLAYLNDIHRRRDTLEPNHKRWKPVRVLDIFRLLPQTNCRQCGFATCLAFAAALSQQQTTPDGCPQFIRPMSEQAVYPIMDSQGNLVSTVTIDLDAAKTRRHLEKHQENVASRDNKLTNLAPPYGAAAPDGDSSLPAPLTDRELEVLRLVAQGATNREISHRLEISPHTIKSHVIHIFNKLGVSDRTQAAVWATRHHLV